MPHGVGASAEVAVALDFRDRTGAASVAAAGREERDQPIAALGVAARCRGTPPHQFRLERVETEAPHVQLWCTGASDPGWTADIRALGHSRHTFATGEPTTIASRRSAAVDPSRCAAVTAAKLFEQPPLRVIRRRQARDAPLLSALLLRAGAKPLVRAPRLHHFVHAEVKLEAPISIRLARRRRGEEGNSAHRHGTAEAHATPRRPRGAPRRAEHGPRRGNGGARRW